jgi:hypothetical protein
LPERKASLGRGSIVPVTFATGPCGEPTLQGVAAQARLPDVVRVAMDALTIFGLVAVSLMLACYALELRSSWFVLGFAGACALGSIYGFLQGAWPFGIVEGIWSLVALQRWFRVRSPRPGGPTSGAPNSVDR